MVLVREVAPQATEAEHLAPTQLLDERYAVQQVAVQVVSQVPRNVLVVDELQRVHVRVCLGLDGVRQVGVGQYQQGVGHLVPHLACLDDGIEVAEGREPKALLQADVRAVVVVVAAEETFLAHHVAEVEDEGIEGDGDADVACLIELLVLAVAELQLQGSHIIVTDGRGAYGCVHTLEGCKSGGILPTVAQVGAVRNAVVQFVYVAQLRLALVGGAHVLHSLDGQQHVVLACVHVLLAELIDIVRIAQAEGVPWKLLQVLLALVEGVFGCHVVLQFLVAEAVGGVAFEEEVLAEGGCGASAGSQAEAFQLVAADGGVHRSYLELALLWFLVRLHIAAEEDGDGFLRVIEDGHGAQLGHHFLEGLGVLAHGFLRTELLPKVCGLRVGVLQRDDGLALCEGSQVVVRCRFFEGMVGVLVQSAGIHSLRVFLQLEVHGDVVLGDEPRVVFGALEGLLDGHLRHEVQVDVLGHIEHGFLHEVGGVQCHVEVSCEAERFRVEGCEAQVHARMVVHREGVEQVVLVVVGADA